jgi:rhodanese-related sulfurtransferase
MRQTKDALYDQVASLARALASPKRLELIELLCQGEKTVEQLAKGVEISVKLASAHLRALRHARLVHTRKAGKYVHYRMAGDSVANLWVTLRETAQECMVELRMALASAMQRADELKGVNRKTILGRAKAGELVVLDVRPVEEFAAGHLPHALSLPVDELKRRLKEIPQDVPVVAYCRGPFCFMAQEAVQLLREQGRHAFHLTDGVAEWRARGLPVVI